MGQPDTEKPSERMVLAAKVAALVLIFVFAPRAWVPEYRASLKFLMLVTRFGKVPALYSGVVLLAYAGLVVTPFLRHNVIRVVLVTIFMAAFAVDRVVFSLSGSHADTEIVRTLWQGRMIAGPALRAFQGVILQHLAAIAVAAVVLAWPYSRGLRKIYALIPAAGLVLVTVHSISWVQVVEGYPSPFAIPARLVKVLTDQTTVADLPLKPVPAGHLAASPFTKIVLILDESVRGDYLSINNPAVDTTPFLQQPPQPLINFGIATSGSNCSYQARWLLRRGLRPWQLPEERMPSPRTPDGVINGPRTTLWQFAQAAGFKTTYIDAWSSLLGPFHEGTSAEEVTFLDQRISLDAEAQPLRDRAAARRLRSMLTTPERAFIQVDKLGPHLPYDEFSPPDFNRYARSDGQRFKYNRKSHDEVVGSYKNTIAWTVDEFFREILPGLDLRDALILYTSDHGENLGDGGYTWGHCSMQTVHPSEEWVPLFALTGVASFGQALSASAGRSYSQATHFEIFPTLLIAMGYDASWVSQTYGPSLLDIPAGRTRQFVVGDVVRSGRRTWLPVDPWVPPAAANGK